MGMLVWLQKTNDTLNDMVSEFSFNFHIYNS